MVGRNMLLTLILTIAIGLAGLNCAGDSAHSEGGTNGTAGKNVDMASIDELEEEIVPVEITAVTTGDIASFLLLSSNLETERMTDVYSRVQGLIDRIYVEEGDFVKKDQILMHLEPDELKLREARALVDYEQEKNLYERKQQMFEKNLLSKEEFENAKFALQAKKIAWEEAKLNLDHTKITAPISGVIGERLRRPGDRIQPSDKLFNVINSDEMIAVVYVPEKEVGLIRKNQKAIVSSQHLGKEEFAGWIKRVSPVVDPESGTFKVTVGVNNTESRLRPGMFVNVKIITDVHKNTILIPKTAIVYENDRMQVFVVRDSLAHKIDLDLGFQDYEKVESLSGIEAGENVIVVGQAGLRDKAKVNVVAAREITFESGLASEIN